MKMGDLHYYFQRYVKREDEKRTPNSEAFVDLRTGAQIQFTAGRT